MAQTKSSFQTKIDGTLGVAQTWQDMTASRAIGTTYTNTTGKPISVAISILTNTATVNSLTCQVDGVTVAFTSADSAGRRPAASFIVPAGSTYNCTTSQASTIATWAELR